MRHAVDGATSASRSTHARSIPTGRRWRRPRHAGPARAATGPCPGDGRPRKENAKASKHGSRPEKWGEWVVAVVQPTPGANPDPAQVAAFTKERISSVKAPKEVSVWPGLKRSEVGKVLKRTSSRR
ncbi:AMP-binding enzyme [Dermacoccus abyssi]|uniref:AMP-binding enzyme n=1 Tax=Dermacoccus abyssi TaxID=322596 RepID=UPI0030B81D92